MFVIQNVGYGVLLSSSILVGMGIVLGAIGAYVIKRFLHVAQGTQAQVLDNPSLLPITAPNFARYQDKNAYLSQRLRSVVARLINSQYVLLDRESYPSLMQTPLRKNIHDLRLIADALLTSPESPIAHQTQWDTHSDVHDKYAQLAFEQLCRRVAGLCESRGIRFDYCCELNIDQVLQNDWLLRVSEKLMLNAIKYNDTDITLSFSVTETDGYLCVLVTDTGKGIPSRVTQYISSQYTSAQPHFRRNSDLNGALNLSAISQYVRERGGELVIKSAREYSTHISLCVGHDYVLDQNKANVRAVRSSPAIDCKETKTTALVGTKQKQLLLIGQPQQYLTSLTKRLQQNYDVLHKNSLEGALLAINEHNFDCILIDAEADFSNGLSLHDYVTGLAKQSDTALVMLGQNDPCITQLSVMQAGISGYIEKPISPEAVHVVIDKVIAEKRKIQSRVETVLADYHSDLAELQNVSTQQHNDFPERFMSMLAQHYHQDDLTRPKAASILCIEEKTLSRRLSKHYQIGFSELLKRFRLNKAKDMIVQGERVTTAAYNAGFNSPSYFTQCFRAQYGFAPSMLTKQHRCA